MDHSIECDELYLVGIQKYFLDIEDCDNDCHDFLNIDCVMEKHTYESLLSRLADNMGRCWCLSFQNGCIMEACAESIIDSLNYNRCSTSEAMTLIKFGKATTTNESRWYTDLVHFLN